MGYVVYAGTPIKSFAIEQHPDVCFDSEFGLKLNNR
jgi:hypothetical protein